MGKASRRKAERHTRELAAVCEHEHSSSHQREVPYESLLLTGRAIRYHRKPASLDGSSPEAWGLEVQLAGLQGSEAGPNANRSFVVWFATKQSAQRTGDSLLTQLRKWHRTGRINTDVRYNKILHSWAAAVKAEIEKINAELLDRAERVAQHTPTLPRLIDYLTKREERVEEKEQR